MLKTIITAFVKEKDNSEIVCRCMNVREQEIRRACKKGKTFSEIQDITNISLGCGACIPRVKEIIEEELQKM